MGLDSNYWLIWFFYVLASTIFYGFVWRLTRSDIVKWGIYSLRGITAAIIFTPWSANIQGDTLAPALMVLVLDSITSGGEAVTRAGVPLVLGIIVAELIATALYWLRKRRSII